MDADSCRQRELGCSKGIVLGVPVVAVAFWAVLLAVLVVVL